jgi:hypothetical protein
MFTRDGNLIAHQGCHYVEDRGKTFRWRLSGLALDISLAG